MEKKYYIAPDARVLGDVELSENVSIWYGAVVRGTAGKLSSEKAPTSRTGWSSTRKPLWAAAAP